MLRKFMDGLVFGAGFGTAFIVLWAIASLAIFPIFFESEISRVVDSGEIIDNERLRRVVERYSFDNSAQFHTLSIEEQVAAASAIALVKYEPAVDGRMQAIIKEFLKLEPGIEISYEVGDEHSGSSYYPRGDSNRGDGLVVFFTGSPAVMQLSTSIYGDRITGLGDIPIALFREKCAKDGA